MDLYIVLLVLLLQLFWWSKKKNRSLGIRIDYSGLNKVTIKNQCPLTLTNELIDPLVTDQLFTNLNIWNAYYRIRIDKNAESKTTPKKRFGHFEYQVMPYGLINAFASF